MKTIVLPLLALALSHQSNALDYPGTKTRPILSDVEASKYTIDNYFSGWKPEEIVIPDEPDYVVEEGQSIQAVVNKAIKSGSSAFRTYIKVKPGHYMETVYIKGNVPLTLYGAGDSPADVHIMASISAKTSVSDYKNAVNKDGLRYQEGDPAWDLYNYCAIKVNATIDTECTAVLWVKSDNFQLQGVTVHNSATDAQAVAVKTAADQIHLMNNNFLGFQDTVGLGIEYGDSEEVQRVLVHMCYIEGQVDYVFGGAAAVFNMVTFNSVKIKESSSVIVFAPDTEPKRSYGFLVINSNITGDASYLGSNKVSLARSWDHGIKSADVYVPGESPNGQLVIRDSNIDNVINVVAPYSAAATSKRPFVTDISADRDLDDNNHNRLWEYNNSGNGA